MPDLARVVYFHLYSKIRLMQETKIHRFNILNIKNPYKFSQYNIIEFELDFKLIFSVFMLICYIIHFVMCFCHLYYNFFILLLYF